MTETKKADEVRSSAFVVQQLVGPERFELPTTWFVARYSIQLSYGPTYNKNVATMNLAESEGFEPSIRL